MNERRRANLIRNRNLLSSETYWSRKWSDQKPVSTITFDPSRPSFRDQHRLFLQTLPRKRDLRLLEVGCYPGRFMWYFHRYFGYHVSGLDYVEWCCDQSRQLLQKEGIAGEVIHGNLFAYQPPSPDARWDVVASFGFIEHFNDTAGVIRKHLDLLKPGGYLVLAIPNHQGVYGRFLQALLPEEYVTHNRMGYEDMRAALDRTGQATILAGGYCGRLGFWNTGLYTRASEMGRLPYVLVRTPLWGLEQLGRLLPNSARMSPNAVLIARKLP